MKSAKEVQVKDSHREEGTIASVFSGRAYHEIPTVCVDIDLGGGCHQGFGNLVLDEKGEKLFLRELCDLFHVQDPKQLVGKKCFALRSFSEWNTPIEGLEAPDGKHFTITSFRKRHYPNNSQSVIRSKKQSLRDDIARYKHQIKEAEQDLEALDDDYVDWEHYY